MWIEKVLLGNGRAVELRDVQSLASFIFMLCDDLAHSERPAFHGIDAPIDDFISATWAVIRANTRNQHRWLLYCGDLEWMTDEGAEEFETACEEWLGVRHELQRTPENDPRRQVGLMDLRSRCWLVDTLAMRVFCVHVDFAPPIYKGTILEGLLLPQLEFETSYLSEASLGDEEQVTTKQPLTERERVLESLQRLSGVTTVDVSAAGVAQRQNKIVFVVRCAPMWCGQRVSLERGGESWIAQQVNVWFNTPLSEDCWFHPSTEKDVAIIRVALWSECDTLRDTLSSELTRYEPPSPGPDTTITRYPRSNVLTAIPGGLKCIGEQIPLLGLSFSSAPQNWLTTRRITEVRLFRIYRTQYPFIFTLLPDDDTQVRAITTQLKRSADSNPSLGEKGREKLLKREAIETVKPLTLSLPTLECQRYVRAVFRENPKHQYRRFYCACFDGEGQQQWVPIQTANKKKI
jgi:hypothetical protein